MNQLGTVYATKRRRRNGKSLKPAPKDGVTKSNPSKRHRERLNAELDTLASLLPFEQNILSKLDRLSILRLSVSYLRTKSYFQVVMHKDKDDGGGLHRPRDLTAFDHTPLDGEMFLQALNGFLMILTCEGEVFFATHSIEGYLGFHQSDIVHQSVYELVHSEDREELQRQLMWNSFLPPESANIGLQDVLLADNCHMLERSFTVRFRCLLDNTSGFLRLDIRGRVKVLHGQNRKSEEPPLALFAICTPFGPPSLLEIPQKEVMFKSKHKLDLALVSMDQRGKMLLGYSDSELANMGGYDLVHYDDLAYVASAHQELLKTGASGMIAYRFQTKDGQWQWLQTSSRLVYKNSKPDFVISSHRPLMEEEGRDLLGKRTMDFKVSYLDAGLPNAYFSETEQLLSSNSAPLSQPSATPNTRVNRRYKTQLRDFLSTCRTKRKLTSSSSTTSGGQLTPPSVSTAPSVSGVEYLSGDATAYNMHGVYPGGYPAVSPPDLGGYANFHHHHHQLYPGSAAAPLDNRYLATTENLFHHQYRPLGTYYPEYHSAGAYVGNGFLEMSSRAAVPTYDPDTYHHRQEEKLYTTTPFEQQVIEPSSPATTKYPYVDTTTRAYTKCLNVSSSWPYSVGPSSGIIQPVQVLPELKSASCNNAKTKSIDGMSVHDSSSPGLLTPKMEEIKDLQQQQQQNESPIHHHSFSPVVVTTQTQVQTHTPTSSPTVNNTQEMPRQTVLMWGSNHPHQHQHQHQNSPPVAIEYTPQPEMNQNTSVPWTSAGGGGNTGETKVEQNVDPESPHQQHNHQSHHSHHNGRVVMVL